MGSFSKECVQSIKKKKGVEKIHSLFRYPSKRERYL